MSDIDEIRLDQAKKIEIESKWDCHEHEWFSKEHIEECLSEMLAAYVDDERNYVVDGAEIECTEMCGMPHCIKYENGKTRLYDLIKAEKGIERDYIPPEKREGDIFYFGKGLDMTKVRRLYALHARGASDNGIRYATVMDRECLRNIKEGVTKPIVPTDGIPITSEANIISCGNCNIMRESDIPEIEKRLEESIKYGTCYSLIKPVAEWVNPLCAESVSGNCDTTSNFAAQFGMVEAGINRATCARTGHHKVMKFDTKYGQKEGLTMLSTLLCIRGGIITIKVHGQIYLEQTLEDRIQALMDLIEGKPVNSFSEMCKLSTVEILARLIYQEDRDIPKGQNAVAFSIINRLFSEGNFILGTKSNSIYSVITGSSQYESLLREANRTPNSYRPPTSESDSSGEKEAWENAKRLAAITVIAVEEYGNENTGTLEEKDRNENIVSKGDTETYQQVVDFIEQQEDTQGNPIKNEIDTRDSFVSQGTYDGRGNGSTNEGGNTFFWL